MLDIKTSAFASLALVTLACGCNKLFHERDDGAGPRPASISRTALDTRNLPGISDLTRTADGRYYAIPERARFLLPLILDDGPPRLAADPIPIDGIPDGLDTESLASIAGRGDGHNRFATGTESMSPSRYSDDIFILEIEAGRAFFRRRISVNYDQWNFRAPMNQGIEALCASGPTGQYLYVAIEGTKDLDGRRHAPFGRIDLASGALVPSWLPLTTKSGRISGMTCNEVGSQTQLFAIERHYGVSRVLGFTLKGAMPERLEDTIAVNLAGALIPIPNLEGIARAGNGELLLISDNDTGGVSGPTEIVRVKLPSVP